MAKRVNHSEEGAAPAAPTPVPRKRKEQTNTQKPRERSVAGHKVTTEQLGWTTGSPVKGA